jgi:transcriptional regulator with XRE-family HTH domain
MPYQEALKIAIIRAGLKQYEVADMAGIRNPLLSDIITGRIVPSDDEKKSIAKALKKPVADLFPEAVAS